MNLSPPSQVTFILSVLLAVLALLVRYADAAIPVVSGTVLRPWWQRSCCFLQVSCFEDFRQQVQESRERTFRRPRSRGPASARKQACPMGLWSYQSQKNGHAWNVRQ